MSGNIGFTSYVEGTSARFAVALTDVNGDSVPLVAIRLLVLAPGATESFVNPTTEENGQCVGVVDCTAAGLWRIRFESLTEPFVAYEESFNVTKRTVPALVGPGGSAPSVATNWRIGELNAITPVQSSDQIAISRDNITYRTTLGAIADLLGGGTSGGGSGLDSTPEQYGAVGDGMSHRAPAYLGVTTLEQLREWDGGIYSFANVLDVEMDYLGIQAAFFAGGSVRGTPGAKYLINRCLIHPNGRINVNFTGCELNAEAFDADSSTTNLITNPSFDSGITGWTQGTLGPRTDIVFSGGKASFTDPPVVGNHYGDFGQQFTLPAGKWTVRLLIKLSDGASHGYWGPPYMNMGFRSDGVGLGGYDWPHPLSFASLQFRTSPFEGWVSFDVEALEETVTWLDIQGGNCDWEVQEVEVKPFLLNYMVWTTGDPVAAVSGEQYDVSTWVGGELIGPVDGNSEADWSGPVVGGILHKNFLGEGPRCNFERMFVFGWDVGITLGSQAFLNYITNTNIGNSRTCVKFLAGSVNAGENYRLSSCILFNAGLAIHAEGGGEWTLWGCSIDFCRRLILLERGAKVSMRGHHFEFNGSETRLEVTSPTGSFTTNETLTGGTSGATARLIINRTASYGHMVLEVLSGTFVDGETLSGAAGTVVADGAVVYGAYHFDLRGGSLLDFSGEFLQGGGVHRGALHMFNLETNLDIVSCSDWWAYGLLTASGTLCTGAGRFVSRRFLGPGNAQLPAMIMRNLPSDMYAGNGRIYGPGSMHEMDYLGFAKPSDNIGLVFGGYSNGTPTSRGVTPGEISITADATVYSEVGYGSLKIEYAAGYANYSRLAILTPVQPGEIVLSEYYVSKPDVKAAVAHGPFTSAADPNQIWVNTTAGSSVVTIQDNQARWIGGNGPYAEWTVELTDVTGNPGGIANAVWNATHTIVERLRTDDVLYTIDLGPGNEALTSVSDAGGSVIETTYGQMNVLIYDSRFWVRAPRFDAYGRPEILQTSYQGEDNFRLSHDAVDWTLRQCNSHYTEPTVPTGALTENRYANGRAPEWATHFMQLISFDGIRYQDTAAPPPIYLTGFFGNKL